MHATSLECASSTTTHTPASAHQSSENVSQVNGTTGRPAKHQPDIIPLSRCAGREFFQHPAEMLNSHR